MNKNILLNGFHFVFGGLISYLYGVVNNLLGVLFLWCVILIVVNVVYLRSKSKEKNLE